MWISLEDPKNASINIIANIHNMKQPVVYEKISYYDAYKKATYLKKADRLKIAKLEDEIKEDDYVLVDEVFRYGWQVVDFEIYQPSRFGKFNLDTKIKVNSPEGFDIFINAECVVELLAKSEHDKGTFETRLRLNPDSNCLESEEDIEDES